MLAQHDFVTMHVNGVRLPRQSAASLLDHRGPATRFWAYRKFSARFAALALCACFAIHGVLARTRDCRRASGFFFRELVLGTAIGPYIYTRFEIPDIMVGFWLVLTVHLFWRILDQENPSRWAVLVRSPLVNRGQRIDQRADWKSPFPVLIIGGYLLLTGNLRQLLRMRLISTSAVFLAMAVPWHVLATIRNPAQGESKGFFLVLFH